MTKTCDEPEALPAGLLEITDVAAHAHNTGAVAEAVLPGAAASAAAKGGERQRAAVAAAGPSRKYEEELWRQGYANVAGKSGPSALA